MLFQNVMFGTYTRRQSSGIYQAALDLETGKLTKPTLLIQTGSPTYTVMSQAGFLYAVNRQNGQGPTGVVLVVSMCMILEILANQKKCKNG